jgi:alkylation response protein AidB-like acyl-CoA dehydrogenase
MIEPVYEWTDEQLAVRDAVRRFVEAEVAPRVQELEHGDLPPYDLIRKMLSTFGIDAMAEDRFERRLARAKAPAAGAGKDDGRPAGDGGAAALALIPIIELCRYCPGMVTAMGVSLGLAGAARTLGP